MITTVSTHICFGGEQGFYKHDSSTIGVPMGFSVFQPPQAKAGPVPVLFFLAGLTATEESFMMKAGAQRVAAELGLMLVTCDTSPRNTGIDGATAEYDFGEGAGFYLDATEAPWNKHFQMERYVTTELRELVLSNFPARRDRVGIFGHSMGGHGALTLAFRHPALYQSVSAFAPICAPTQCSWGQKAFSRYLGEDRTTWAAHDACELIRSRGALFPDGILVDQGLGDQFLPEQQLHPEMLESACKAVGQPLTLRRHSDYDHRYYFLSTFVADHLVFHHAILGGD